MQGGRLATTASLIILFTLTERSTGRRVDIEQWQLTISLKKMQNNWESYLMTAQFFQEIVLILNKLPLFSVYHKDRQMRMRYFLDHKIIFDHKQSSIFDLRAEHFIQRQNQSLYIHSKVAYCPCLYFLNPQTEAMSPLSKRKESNTLSDYNNDDRRVSVYAFYDPDLNFHFLSSDEENFKVKGEGEEIKMEMDTSQLSEQFQLLIANEDQDFLQDNKDLLESLIQYEKQYLGQ